MKSLVLKTLVSLALSTGAMAAFCQNQPQTLPEPQKGFTGFESFQGSLNSDSKMFKLDSNAGYDFNPHFGIFAGMPLYFANTQTTTTQVNGTATTTTTQRHQQWDWKCVLRPGHARAEQNTGLQFHHYRGRAYRQHLQGLQQRSRQRRLDQPTGTFF